MVPEGGSTFALISDTLEEGLLNHQSKHGALSHQDLISFTVDQMSGLCAPVRDHQVVALRSVPSIQDQISQMFGMLEVMNKDLIRFNLRALKPRLAKNIVQYERDYFKEKSFDLNLTKQIINQVISELKDNSVDLIEKSKFFSTVFVESILKMIFKDCEKFPLLQLDMERINRFNAQTDYIVKVCALALTFKGANIERIKILLRDATIADHSIALELSASPELISSIMKGNSPVYILIHRRLHSFIRHHLQTGLGKTSEIIAKQGLAPMVFEYERLVVNVFGMVSHHRHVFASYYDKIISEIISELE